MTKPMTYADRCRLLARHPGPYENDGDYFQMAIERDESSAVLFKRAAKYESFGWPAGKLLRKAARRIQKIEGGSDGNTTLRTTLPARTRRV